jgi:hypothetical protein
MAGVRCTEKEEKKKEKEEIWLKIWGSKQY